MSNLQEVRDIILSYPKLKERIDSRSDSKAEVSKCFKLLDEIRADVSEKYMKYFEKFLDKSLGALYDGLNLTIKSDDFQELVKNNHVVLVPNHQSHADYLAINYLIYKNYKIPVHVAGGNNLNIFPIGKIFRKTGCFFIRRSFQGDILYKLTFEAYLFYLLKSGKIIEFFFEGGRSRTGKLLPPRFGLYQMLLETHATLPPESKKDLLFLPVSIVHEYVAEQKALASELGGGKKKKESTKQLFGLLKLFSYQFGNVHVNLGNPIKYNWDGVSDIRSETHKLAFSCFREVGKNMAVTPTSLLALILLDEPSGALKWDEIIGKSKVIIEFCEKFNIYKTESLKTENYEKALERAVDILIGNKKVIVIGSKQEGHLFYSIKDDSRQELLYFKNTILHHFLVPWIINSAWINLFLGTFEDISGLKKFFISVRAQLKHEFYLPTIKEMFVKSIVIISDAIGREITSLDECLELSHQEIYLVAAKVGPFANVCNYIDESYLIGVKTLINLSKNKKKKINFDTYAENFKDIFDEEMELKRLVRFKESFSIPLLKNSFKYFKQIGLLEDKDGESCVDIDLADSTLKQFEVNLTNKHSFNFRFQK